MTAISLGATPVTSATVPAKPPRKSPFERFLDALYESRMRQARREMSRHLHLVPADVLEEAGFTLPRNDPFAH
jgi:hypothetical protein